MPRKLHDTALEEVPHLFADGLSAHDISEKLNVPIRTVYSWLSRPDVQERIRAEIDFRESTRRRLLVRHYGALFDFAAGVATGKNTIKSEEQLAMLDAFLGLHLTDPPPRPLPAPAIVDQPAIAAGGDAPMLPAGRMNVHFHVGGDAGAGVRPRIIDADEDEGEDE